MGYKDIALFCGQLSAGFSVKNKKLFEPPFSGEFFLFRKRQRKVARTRLVLIFFASFFLSRKKMKALPRRGAKLKILFNKIPRCKTNGYHDPE